MLCTALRPRQKLGMILANEVVQKWHKKLTLKVRLWHFLTRPHLRMPIIGVDSLFWMTFWINGSLKVSFPTLMTLLLSTQSSDWHLLLSGPAAAYCNLFALGGVGGRPHSIASLQMGSSEGIVEKDPVFSHSISFSNFPVLVTWPSVSQTCFMFLDTSTGLEVSESNSKNLLEKTERG